MVFETTQSEIELSLEKEDEVDMCTAVRNKYNQLRNEGRSEGRVEEKMNSILSIMKKLHYSLKEAMELLNVDESEYLIYEEKLNGLKQL